MFGNMAKAVLAGAVLALCAGTAFGAEADIRKQIDELKSGLRKFAVPMREVGDRFQDMYPTTKGGNWALAAYMSKYMNGAMGYKFIRAVKQELPNRG